MILHNYIRRYAESNDGNFKKFENVLDMPSFRSYFDRNESNSSNCEDDIEIELLKK